MTKSLAMSQPFLLVAVVFGAASSARAQTPVFNPATGHYYVAVSSAGISWTSANTAAASMIHLGASGHLATITDAAENQWISSSVAVAGMSYWIGAFQDHSSPSYSEPSGGWTWVTGEPWSYTHWAAPEPNNICCGGEDWIELQYDRFWNDNYNSNTGLSGYLVEFSNPIVVYCTSGTSSSGCVPSISATGTPSISSSSGFTIRVDSVEGIKQGILFYGLNNPSFTPTPWGNGGTSFLCVKSPTQRMGVQSSGGTLFMCNGVLSADWNAFRAANPGALGSPFTTGEVLCAQAWFRDPPSPKTTLLSNAVRFALQP